VVFCIFDYKKKIRRMGHTGHIAKCRVENRGTRRVGDISTVTIDTRDFFYDEDC
jgi:hypothetical protein